MSDHAFMEKVAGKFVSLFSRKEVKTPLSFFFSLTKPYTAVLLAALYLMDPSLRFRVFLIGLSGYVLLFAGVFLFAWLNPKNLVYGESSHRAELKLGMGTESREIGEAELAATPGTTREQATQDLVRRGDL